MGHIIHNFDIVIDKYYEKLMKNSIIYIFTLYNKMYGYSCNVKWLNIKLLNYEWIIHAILKIAYDLSFF